jgi:Cft2 family RNA processing exonuclease
MMTTTAAKPIECDVLILETTYGIPTYIFPSTEETCIEMVNWIIWNIRKEKIPVFKVYSTGKAQEIIRIINEFTTIPVVTHPSISKVCEAYVKNGIKLNYIESTRKEGQELIKSQQCVYVIPTNVKSTLGEKYSLAYATGWAIKYSTRNGDVKTFPLSNHADFNQLLHYVEQANPKKIYTIHGFKEDFVKYVNKKFSAKAQPIIPLGQSLLKEYV